MPTGYAEEAVYPLLNRIDIPDLVQESDMLEIVEGVHQMSTQKVRIGIVGCGGIANGKHMPSLIRLPEVEMVAFCDIIEERATKAANQYGVDGALVFTDYRDLVALADLDIVHVLTPNHVHAPISIAALKAGKHVMCEKPMATSSREAQAMLDAARKSGKKLTIGYQGRQRAEAQYLKELCDADELGEVYFAKALALRRRGVPTWGVFLDKEKQGGGPLIDIGTHSLDLTLWLMNNYDWDYVVGSTYNKIGKQKNVVNPWGTWKPEEYTVEDSAFAFIKFKNGATVILESSWALNIMPSDTPCVLCGTKAGADFVDGLRILGEKGSRLYTLRPEPKIRGVDPKGGETDERGYLEAKQWIESVINDTQPTVLPEQALVVTEILEAIYDSAKSGKPIYNNR